LGMPSERTNNFPESGRGLGHMTPTIFGSTVGYPSDSLASFLRRGTRSGFYRPDWPSVETLAEDAANDLFRRVSRNGNHLLYTLLPDKNSHGYNLGHRRHDRTLASNQDQRNFVDRQLHKHLRPIHC